jgi:hypothetical protein
LGMPPRHPFFIGKNQFTFQHTIFLLLHALCIFLGASVVLVFSFFSFVYCNKWLDPNKFLLEKLPCFSFAKNTPFSFHFSPWFVFRSYYIFASRCILTSGLCWFSSKELF